MNSACRTRGVTECVITNNIILFKYDIVCSCARATVLLLEYVDHLLSLSLDSCSYLSTLGSANSFDREGSRICPKETIKLHREWSILPLRIYFCRWSNLSRTWYSKRHCTPFRKSFRLLFLLIWYYLLPYINKAKMLRLIKTTWNNQRENE